MDTRPESISPNVVSLHLVTLVTVLMTGPDGNSEIRVREIEIRGKQNSLSSH